MKKYKWVAYGLDMRIDYAIIETEGENISESHMIAVELFKADGIDFDTVELFDLFFIKRTGFLSGVVMEGLLYTSKEGEN